MPITLGGGGSSSFINEISIMNHSTSTVTLSDGRVYLKGGEYSTDTTTYPDAFRAHAPVGLNFSIGSQYGAPRGLAWDGTFFWGLDGNPDRLFKYNSAGVYQSVNFSVAQFTGTTGVVWDANASEFKVVAGSGYVSRYSNTGTYNGHFNITSQTSTIKGITTDGTDFWVLGSVGKSVFKYNSSFVYQSTVATGLGSPSYGVQGLTFDGTHFYVVDSGKNVYKYNSSWVLQSSFPVVSDTNPQDIMSKRGGDTSLFVTGQTTFRIHEYQLAMGVSNVGAFGGNNYVRIA